MFPSHRMCRLHRLSERVAKRRQCRNQLPITLTRCAGNTLHVALHLWTQLNTQPGRGPLANAWNPRYQLGVPPYDSRSEVPGLESPQKYQTKPRSDSTHGYQILEQRELFIRAEAV